MLNSSPSFLSNLAFHLVFFTLCKLNDLYVFKLKNTLYKYNTLKINLYRCHVWTFEWEALLKHPKKRRMRSFLSISVQSVHQPVVCEQLATHSGVPEWGDKQLSELPVSPRVQQLLPHPVSFSYSALLWLSHVRQQHGHRSAWHGSVRPLATWPTAIRLDPSYTSVPLMKKSLQAERKRERSPWNADLMLYLMLVRKVKLVLKNMIWSFKRHW